MPRRMLCLVAGLVMLTACRGPGSHAFTTQTTAPPAPVETAPATTAPVPPPPPPPIAITGTGFDLHTAGPVGPAAFDAAWAGVLDTLNRYLEAGVLTPLRSGGPANDLTPFFTPSTAERVIPGGPDRFAFIDENLPPVSDVRAEAAVAGLTALAGPDGIMSVVTAGLDLRLVGHINGALVTVTRTGELVLVPEGGTWRIDAYDISVTRTIADSITTTTVRS
ncbi:MAG: hypothetical protein ACR2KK_05660 [Acidimicrobiales bacterium]